MAKNPTHPIAQRLIDAAMALVASHGWRTLSMDQVAEEAGVTMTDAMAVFGSIHALLERLFDKVDKRALAEVPHFQDEDTIRDRLFALLMARLDALQPYKPAMACLIQSNMCHPQTLITRLPRLMSSMVLMLGAAGAAPSGPMGLIRTKGLAVIYLTALRIWLRDDTEDLAATMAALDKGLGRAEMLALQFCRKTKSIS